MYSTNLSGWKREVATVAFADLDSFGTCVKSMGWTEYAPNIITSFMTRKAMNFIRNFHAINLWGIRKQRGTEEFILAFFQKSKRVEKLMGELVKQVNNLAKKNGAPTSLSVGLAIGPLSRVKPLKNNSKKELKKRPTVYLAYKALREAKKDQKMSIVRF